MLLFLTVRYGKITKTGRQEGGRTARHTAMQADTQPDTQALQTHRQAGMYAGRQTHRQAGIFARQRNRHINRQADRLTDRQE